MNGFPGGLFKGFDSLEAAQSFMNDDGDLPMDATEGPCIAPKKSNRLRGKMAVDYMALDSGNVSQRSRNNNPPDSSILSIHSLEGLEEVDLGDGLETQALINEFCSVSCLEKGTTQEASSQKTTQSQCSSQRETQSKLALQIK